jgi:uncharacterized protein (DUF952 family)
MTRMIYHMCPEEAWAQAAAGGRYDGGHLFPPLV